MLRRLFLAIPINESLRLALERFCRANVVEGIRWIYSQNFHITVHFVGDVDDEKLLLLINAIKNITENTKSFELEFDKLEFAPLGKPPRMIWGIFKECKEFSDFVYSVRKVVRESVGGLTDNHKPMAHITLTRLKNSELATQVDLSTFKSSSRLVDVSTLILFESELHSRGAQYLPLQEFDLAI